MSKKVVVMANLWPGKEICNYFKKSNDDLVRIYLVEGSNPYAEETKEVSGLEEKFIFSAKALKDPEHIKEFKELAPDFIITVYWPYLLKPEVYESAGNTVNFHPALLPVNRGWYPHVHSLIDGSPNGVTLHAIDESADTGPIWVQKEVDINTFDTAKPLHERMQKEIVELFIENWPKISAGELSPFKQDESRAIYHSKKEVDSLDQIDLEKSYKAKDLINLLRARSYGNKGFAYYMDGEEKVYMNLRIGPDSNFGGSNE